MVLALHFDVDLRRDAEVEYLADHIGGLKVKENVRECLMQLFTQASDVIGRATMAFLERDQDLSVIDPDGGAVSESKIVEPLGQSDVVQH